MTAKVTRPPTVTAGEVNERDVFQLFVLSNTYTDFGTIREYHYREMKAKAPSSNLTLPQGSTEFSRSVAETWPLNNESNVRVFSTKAGSAHSREPHNYVGPFFEGYPVAVIEGAVGKKRGFYH